MSRHVAISYRPMIGTGAGIGLTDGRSLIADRPDGVAGGQGLGFNGAELMAAAIGGCFWNDLNYVASAQSTTLIIEALEAEVELAGNPPRIVRARVAAAIAGAEEPALQAIFDAAAETSTVAGSINDAIPVLFERKPATVTA